MKTCGVLTTQQRVVEFTLGKPIYLIIFGDIHRDAELHAADPWREFLAYAKAKAKRDQCLFLGMGDYVDGFSTSERALLADGRLHESSSATIEKVMAGWVDKLAGELSFMRGNLLGLISGNHYTPFTDGTTSDTRLCQALACQFLGVQSIYRLLLKGDRGKSIAWDIAAHHGTGSGRTAGSTFNSLEQMVGHIDADAYIMGHDHKRGAVPAPPKIRLVPTGGGGLALRQREPWLVRSGSFLRSYENGRRSYNVDAARGPCSLGHVELELTVRRQTTDGQDLMKVHVRGIT